MTSQTENQQLKEAITLLAEWTLCVELNGSGWDDWDECYKDAAYRPGNLRTLIDAERDRLKVAAAVKLAEKTSVECPKGGEHYWHTEGYCVKCEQLLQNGSVKP